MTDDEQALAVERALRGDSHTFVECRCVRTGCQFCDGGLAACKICGGFEGSLTTHCRGSRLSQPVLDAVYAGAQDFVGGEWVATASPHSQGFYSR